MGSTLVEIRKKGWKVLVKELGPADATKFILLYEPGEGNYTKDRKRFLKNVTLRKIAKELNLSGKDNPKEKE
jgi:hypothetical protein